MFKIFSTNKTALLILRIATVASLILLMFAIVNVFEYNAPVYFLVISAILAIILSTIMFIALPSFLPRKKTITKLKELKALIEKEYPDEKFNVTLAHGSKFSFFLVYSSTVTLTTAFIFSDNMFFIIPITNNQVLEPALFNYADFNSEMVNLDKNYIEFKLPGSKIWIKSKDSKTQIFRNSFENNEDAYLKLRNKFNHLA